MSAFRHDTRRFARDRKIQVRSLNVFFECHLDFVSFVVWLLLLELPRDW